VWQVHSAKKDVAASGDSPFFALGSELCHSPQEATNGTRGWEVALTIAASRRAIIEESAIQNFFSSNSRTVLTIELMLASTCNAASQIRKNLSVFTQSGHEELFPC
jgi:hypothetical protein